MTISELICRLQAIKCEHGDLPILLDANDCESPVIKVEDLGICKVLYIYLSAKD